MYEYLIFLTAAKEREKAQKLAAQKAAPPPAAKVPRKAPTPNGKAAPAKKATVDQQQLDISALNLNNEKPAEPEEEPPKMTIAREKVLEEAKRALDVDSQTGKKGINLVVVGKLSVFYPLRKGIEDILKVMLMLENQH